MLQWLNTLFNSLKAHVASSDWAARSREPEPLAALVRTTSAQFTLEPLRESDAAALRAITDHPMIADAIPFLGSPFTLGKAHALIAANRTDDDSFMAVRRNADRALVGVVGVHLRGESRIEIGYWMAPYVHGQGYATEAVQAVTTRVHAVFPSREIFAECRPDNGASWRVLEKCGFFATGVPGSRRGREVLVMGAPRVRDTA